MSTLHYIKTKQNPDLQRLSKEIQKTISNVKINEKSETLYYFWLDQESTRGVDVSIEKPFFVEIRNTAHSNSADYRLTNLIADELCHLFQGEPFKDNDDYDEDDSTSPEFSAVSLPLFSAEKIAHQPIHDAQILKVLVDNETDAITLFGSVRTIDIGPSFLKDTSTPADIAKKIETAFLDLNYKYAHLSFSVPTIIGAGEVKKTVCRISRYYEIVAASKDYFFIDTGYKYIALTPNDLSKILPPQWKRLDEYRFYTQPFAEEDFENFIKKAEKLDKLLSHLLSNGELMRYKTMVYCNCISEKKVTTPPPFPDHVILGNEGWTLDFPEPDPREFPDAWEEYHDKLSEFEDWQEHACEHPNMLYHRTTLSNYKTLGFFKAILENTCPEEYPTLSQHVEFKSAAPLPVSIAVAALQELKQLKSEKIPVMHYLLQERESKRLVEDSFEGCTSELLAFDNNKAMVLDDGYFYILEKRPYEGGFAKFITFKAKHFVMVTGNEDDSVAYIDPENKKLQNGVRYDARMEDRPDNSSIEYKVVEETVDVVTYFSQLIQGLEEIFMAAVEMQNPVCYAYNYYE